MAKQTMIDTTVLIGGSGEALDISGQANACEFSGSADEVDVTAFSDLAHRRIGALEDASFSLSVLDENAADPWTTLTDLFAAQNALWAWIESNSAMAEADRGIMLRALESQFQRGGALGSARQMEASGVGDSPIIMAQVLQQDESLASTGNSTGFQFGDLLTGETLYCVHWVLSVTGTITGTIESDDNSGFTTATTRASFTAATTVDAELQTVAGPVTDDWWRYEYTIVTGPAVVVAMIGKR